MPTQEEIQQQEQQLRDFNPQVLQSQRQLRQATPSSQQRIQQQEQLREQQRQQMQNTLEQQRLEFEQQQLEERRMQEQPAQFDQKAFERQIRKLANSNVPLSSIDKSLRDAVQDYREVKSVNLKALQSYKEAQELQGATAQIKVPEKFQSFASDGTYMSKYTPPIVKPVSSVSKAPTIGEQYSNFIKNRNPVTGTFAFGVEKAFGQADILTQRTSFNRGQNPLVGESGQGAKQLIEIAPYFINPVGGAYALASGLGQFTKGGQAEVKTQAKLLQQEYNLPTKYGEPALYGVAGGLAVLGGFQVAKETVPLIESKLGYPKYEIIFLTTARPVGSSASESLTIASTSRKGLLSDRTFESVSADKLILKDNIFVSSSQGFVRENKGIFAPPQTAKDFSSLSVGTMKPAELEVPFSNNARFSLQGTKQTGLTLSKGGELDVSVGFNVPLSSKIDYAFSRSAQVGVKNINRADAKGFIFKLSPVSQEIESGFSLIRPAQIQKTPWSVTFPKEQIQKEIENIIGVERASTLAFTKPTVKITGATTQPIRTQSAYWGLGLYEKTDSVSSPFFRTLNIPTTQPKLKLYESNLFGIASRLQLDQRQKDNLLFGNITNTIIRPSQIERINQGQVNIPRLNTLQTSQQRDRLRFTNLQPIRARGEPTRPIKRIVPIGLKLSSKRPLRIDNIKPNNKDLFVGEIRRRGKFFEVARGSLDTALKSSIGKVRSSLGASFRVLQGGKPVKVSAPFGFGYSKRDKFVIVQRRNLRLSSPSEVREIKQSRKNIKFFK